MGQHRGGIVVSAVCAAAMLAGCGGDGPKVFGDQPDPCPAVESSYDETAVDAGADCFISEVREGSPVVWDVIRWTPEGDPIPFRYEFNGDEVTITTDYTRDTLGGDGMIRERCDSIVRGQTLPQGVHCTSAPGDGFKSDSLPS